MTLPRNIVTKHILVTDLSQQLKKQRDFLRWMGRRYSSINEDQSAAFFTGARMFDELRGELLQGSFDVLEKDLFTNQELVDQIHHINQSAAPPLQFDETIYS